MTLSADLMGGPVRSRPGGPVEKIVVAGGYEGGDRLRTTEIFDIASETWSEGNAAVSKII